MCSGSCPDTIILPQTATAGLMGNTDWLTVYTAGQNAGRGHPLHGSPARSDHGPLGAPVVLLAHEQGARPPAGHRRLRSDTRPLEATPVYPEGNGPNGGPTESFRSDTTRKRVLAVDQPLAACWINGI
jgi:hypothetical protein